MPPNKLQGKKHVIKDDISLLEAMLCDSEKQPPLYNPGKYWVSKAKNSAKQIKKHGLSNFRGSDNLIGLSYADNELLDFRNVSRHGFGGAIVRKLANTFPMNRLFNAQVSATKSIADRLNSITQKFIDSDDKTQSLIENYVIPYSILGGCESKVQVKGQDCALSYINLLEQHDNIARRINFEEANSIFEIGGGFGTNIHLLLENYPNIRKVIYLDIPPNLYVGTQYLKSFYGNSVIDYLTTRELSTVQFTDNEELEIFCIAPWQIEQLNNSVDVFINAHSFVEMPIKTAQNYADKISCLSNDKNTAIALTTYDKSDPSTTFNPNEIPGLFKDIEFISFEHQTLLHCSRVNLYYVYPGFLTNK